MRNLTIKQKKEMNKNVLIENVDLELLKEQRDFLLEEYEMGTNDLIDGLVNMLDSILDKFEEE